MNRIGIVLIFGLMFLGFVSGAVVDDKVLEKFESGEKRVAVIIDKNMNFNGIRTMSDVAIEKIVDRGDKFSAYVSESELAILMSDPKVKKVRMNFPLRAFLDESVTIVGVDSVRNLEVNEINLTGASQSVCILDTGINTTHPDFAGRILDEKCYCSVSDSGSGGCCPDATAEDSSAADDDGHGTHVAGIIGANGGIDGIAGGVGLVIVKIMNGTGDGNSLDLEDGIQWCLTNAAAYNISVITASLGGATKYTSTCDGEVASTTSKINSASAQNISVTIASGNNGWTDGISWPSCISSAIPIGAVDKNDDLIYNRASLVKLFGIGVSVNSTCIIGDSGEVNGYCSKGGTSMATPMVAGAIAIINQFLNLSGRTMTPLEIENVLYETGENVSELGNDYARINVYDAVLSLDIDSPNVTLVSPTDNKINLTINQTFVCNATDWQLTNVTLKVWNSSGLYYNASNNLTGTANDTSFDLNNMSFGTYEWNCLVFDVEGNSAFASANYTLTIGGIEMNLNSPENNSYTNVNETNFSCTSTSDSDYELSNVSFYLWNSSGNLTYNVSENISGFDDTTVFNFTFEEEGGYFWNCLAVNNGTTEAWGTSNFSITYDVTVPNLTLIGTLPTSVTSNSVSKNFEFNVSDTNLANCSLIINDAVSLTNSSINISVSQIFSQTFTPGTYAWKINCSDFASNVNSSAENSFTITAVPSSSSSSGGGGGGGSSSTSVASSPKIYEAGINEIARGYTQSLKKNEKISFSVSNFESGQHSLTVDEVGVDYVELTIESEPINLRLNVGQSVKLNLTSPAYYDFFIKLNSVSGSSADLTIQLISEPIEVEVVEISEEEEVVEKEISGRNNYFWKIILALVVILLIIKFAKKLKGRKTSRKKDEKKKKVKA